MVVAVIDGKRKQREIPGQREVKKSRAAAQLEAVGKEKERAKGSGARPKQLASRHALLGSEVRSKGELR